MPIKFDADKFRFAASTKHPLLDFVWGGGWTADTVPTSQGWRALAQRGRRDLAVIGKRGVAGCASVVLTPHRGKLDVMIFDDLTPEVVSARLQKETLLGDRQVWVTDCPGWGVTVLRALGAEIPDGRW